MKDIQCAKCPFKSKERVCQIPEGGKHPPYCPTVQCPEAHEQAKEIYLQEDSYKFAAEAARQEAKSGMVIDGSYINIKTRVVETVEFCKRMGYKHIGIAFCSGLMKEARIMTEILETNGFKVSSVVCKVGCVNKTHIGLSRDEMKHPADHESMCNNIDQALILNEQGTDFNIVMGLCVGHDSLFIENSKAKCTVLIVKDRALGHNPVQALYLYDSYFDYTKKPIV